MGSLLRRSTKSSRTNLLQPSSPALSRILLSRLHNLDKAAELDHRLTEFNDTKYHIRSSHADPQCLEISISVLSSSEGSSSSSTCLPASVIEAVRMAYGHVMEVLSIPEEGYQLTVNIQLAKFPPEKDDRMALVTKVASLRSFLQGAQIREIFSSLSSNKPFLSSDNVMSVVHPMKNLFIFPLPEKAILIWPVQFKEATDVVLATSFLLKFMEASNSARTDKVPSFVWSQVPPAEIKAFSYQAKDANAGFISCAIHPDHVEGSKLERIVWSVLSFREYLHYHIKRSKGFIQSLMRRHVDNMIQALNKTRLHIEEEKTTQQGGCIMRLWKPQKAHTLYNAEGCQKRQLQKISVPIHLHRINHHKKQYIAWRCIKALRVSSLRKFTN